MKAKITAAIFAVAFIAMSFKLVVDKTGAVVEMRDGLQVFAFSRPTAKYDILGTVQVKGMVKNEKGPHMVELLVGNAKKDYPSGEGVIVNSNFEKAEVIRFKE